MSNIRSWAVSGVIAALASVGAHAADTDWSAQLQRFAAEAGAAGQASRGQMFFTQRHGGEWSCASCHGSPPTQHGKHASTGKAIAPLAPAFNPKGFTDAGKVDKWFRRNCNDVLQRACTAQEKADVMAYLGSLK